MNGPRSLALALVLALPAAASAQETDPATGLLIAEDWELVRNNCTACHGAGHITNQRGSRETWKDIIRWMQATQNLWQFEPAVEERILDYLAANYPPGESYRRAPLSKLLMPENPYQAPVAN